ncbi:uncharacterized protein [Clytia hemisphaerica]|uniref:PA14 domain-containing protein n=1 Tax=Clytia hemisphaerica TaxID=252671 RepID=A0A7M5VHH4_9CNID
MTFKKSFSAFIVLAIFNVVTNQVLKFKTDSCSTKIQAKLRVQSILIAKKISAHEKNIQTLRDCFTRCTTNCGSFAYHESKKTCLIFTEVLAKEVISRFMSEGWQYGKVNSKNKIILYVKSIGTCNEEYCQGDSCLFDVKETCTPSIYSLPDCEQYNGVLTGCDHARSVHTDTPPLAMTEDNTPFDPTQPIAMSIDGIYVHWPCPEDVEHTKILIENGRQCLHTSTMLNQGWHRRWEEWCIKQWHVHSYNRVTGEMYERYDGRWFMIELNTDFNMHRFISMDDPTRKLNFIRTGFGTFDVGNGFYLGKKIVFHNVGYFVGPQTQHLPIDAYNYINFTNIPGAVKASAWTFNQMDLEAVRTLGPPHFQGRYDNFQSYNFDGRWNDYSMMLQSFFVPPTNGLYQFILVSDDNAKLYISNDHQESGRYEIIHNTEWGPIDDYSHRSSQIELVAGKEYYLEIIGHDNSNDEYFIAGVILPSGEVIVPITYKYLKPYW